VVVWRSGIEKWGYGILLIPG
jgi:hypothetical protein